MESMEEEHRAANVESTEQNNNHDNDNDNDDESHNRNFSRDSFSRSRFSSGLPFDTATIADTLSSADPPTDSSNDENALVPEGTSQSTMHQRSRSELSRLMALPPVDFVSDHVQQHEMLPAQDAIAQWDSVPHPDQNLPTVDDATRWDSTTAPIHDFESLLNPALTSEPSPAAPTDEWLQEDKIEDEWSKAFTSTDLEPDPDSSWHALANELDDDGFLDDTQPAFVAPQQQQQTPQYQQQPLANPFGMPSPRSAITSQAPPPAATPMKFFEDLPITQPTKSRRPRQPVMQQAPASTPPPSTYTQTIPPARTSSYQVPQSQPQQFRTAERLDPFPPQPSVQPVLHSQQPPPNTRYSPAPQQPVLPSAQTTLTPNYSPTLPTVMPAAIDRPPPSRSPYAPPPAPAVALPVHPQTSLNPQTYSPQSAPLMPSRRESRYSPAPPAVPSQHSTTSLPPNNTFTQPPSMPPPQPPPANRFAPRTSSPLAQPHSRPTLDRSFTAPTVNPQSSSDSTSTATSREVTPTTYTPSAPQNVSRASDLGLVLEEDQATLSRSAPHNQHQNFSSPPRQQERPPLRPRTQSPETSRAKSLPATSPPISQHSQMPSIPISQHPQHDLPRMTLPPRSGPFTDDMQFLPPSDQNHATDPLQRWKGSPIFHWSPAGSVSIMIPKRVPRYGGGNAAPALKCDAGDIQINKLKDTMPDIEGLLSFPGPLKPKAKKEKVLTWLSARIDVLKRESDSLQISTMDSRVSERILLWQVVRLLLEHDGALFGNPPVDQAVRQILYPNSEASANIVPDSPSKASHESADPGVILQLRQHLFNGEREKAIWHAADKGLWGHAMLLSSTLDQSIWKQVIQEFVRKQFRSSTDETKSMAALYETFAGNWDESIDELVPASARAGFQMVATADNPGQHRDAITGLDKWQETLTLILSNRSTDDEKSLLALGNLLRGYGRIEAAHVCFLFARSLTHAGGIDDTQASFTLLGCDVANLETPNNIDAVLLTEVYEMALSLPATNSTSYLPHLQSYKLYHAQALADYGLRNEALSYCEAIATAMKSTTRMSPYYHPILATQVDDLSKLLSQTPKDGSSSWITRPSVGKVSGSMWNKFNKFVAGEESDAMSNASGPPSDTEHGPFAQVNSGPPTISRSASNLDGYASDRPNTGTSRYAPTSYAPQIPETSSFGPYQPSMEPQLQAQPLYSSPPVASDSFESTPRQNGYQSYAPNYPAHEGISIAKSSNSYAPLSFNSTENDIVPPLSNGYTPSYNQPADTFEPQSNGYEPPSSYQPYEPSTAEPTSPDENSEHRAFSSHSDDLSTRPTTLKSESEPSTRSKSSADKAADDAFRAAAAADGASLPQPPSIKTNNLTAALDKKDKRASSSWLGGWFKKDPSAPVVHRAKLGEESSFVFDPDTKRWVNKKAASTTPSTSSTPSAPPPGPPRSSAPPSRSVSAAPSDLHPPVPRFAESAFSRAATPASDSSVGDALEPTGLRSSSGPPGMPIGSPMPGSASLVPPGGSAMSGSGQSGPPAPAGDSIDDLLGAPGSRKSTVRKKKGGGRYVDVMAK